jgi:hypothetical protein
MEIGGEIFIIITCGIVILAIGDYIWDKIKNR